MHIDSSSRVAVLDLTHGGIVLARKLKDIAGSVVAVDVYKTLDSDVLESLGKEGIKTFLEPIDVSDFDIIFFTSFINPISSMRSASSSTNIFT